MDKMKGLGIANNANMQSYVLSLYRNERELYFRGIFSKVYESTLWLPYSSVG